MTNYPGGFTGGVSLYGRNISVGDGSGSTYFVDGNSGHDGNNGSSWDDAYKTLAVAFAASHANIASASNRWTKRNTIFISADDFTETLVILPQKTDVIGVGSSDPYSKPCIRGNHAPVNTANGCRFINVRFRPTASTDLMTLTSVSAGVQFIDCLFDAHYSTFTAPSAIDATGVQFMRVEGCEFVGAFSGDVIDLAGRIDQLRIANNVMIGGADNGIVVTATTSVVQGRFGTITNNIIKVADKVIDDGSDDVIFIADNRCQSDEAAGASAYVINDDWAVNNIICCSDEVIMIPQLSNVVS
jgi:hypothetical protein